MKRIEISKKVVSLNLSDVIFIIKRNVNLIMIISFYTSGLICGAVTANIISSGMFFCKDAVCTFLLLNLINIVILTVNFIMGLGCVGKPLVYVNIVFCGYYIGFAVSQFLLSYEINGILSFILRMPFAVIFSVTVIISSVVSVDMSEELIKFTFFGKNNFLPIKSYLIKYFLMIISCVISSFLYFLPDIFISS